MNLQSRTDVTALLDTVDPTCIPTLLAHLERLRNEPAASADSITDQIMKLGELRDAGFLTNAEFNAKKAELLARL